MCLCIKIEITVDTCDGTDYVIYSITEYSNVFPVTDVSVNKQFGLCVNTLTRFS